MFGFCHALTLLAGQPFCHFDKQGPQGGSRGASCCAQRQEDDKDPVQEQPCEGGGEDEETSPLPSTQPPIQRVE